MTITKFKSVHDVAPLIQRFFEVNNRYPTTVDFNKTDYLPSARLIQRRFGGMVKMREQLGFAITNYTEGDVRRETAIACNKRAHDEELKIYEMLVDKFTELHVHREKLINDKDNNRCDFCIFLPKSRKLFIDVFTPQDKYSLQGCIDSKKRKYEFLTSYPIIFLQTNPNIDFYKKGDFYEVMSLHHFKKFLSSI